MYRKSSLAIKIVLFIILFFVGWNMITLEFFVDLHENGHIEAYRAEGVKAWRVSSHRMEAEYYTFNGLMGGYRAGFRVALIVYAALFLLSFNQFWIIGPAMGLLARSFEYAYGGTDFTRIARWSDQMFSSWVSTEGLYLCIAIGAFIAIKLIPEIYKAFKGESPGHPYKTEPTYLP